MSNPRGRPRSESARRAVLEAVDDMVVEVGYAAITMKGIAERAGVGRQTVYRWWTTKADILFEACSEDARKALSTEPRRTPSADLLAYLAALNDFLQTDAAGLAYRALIGEAQHDHEVQELLRGGEVLAPTACVVLDRVRPSAPAMPAATLAVAQLIGPIVTPLLVGPAPLTARELTTHVRGLLAAWGAAA